MICRREGRQKVVRAREEALTHASVGLEVRPANVLAGGAASKITARMY